jgi:hypothetical protein
MTTSITNEPLGAPTAQRDPASLAPGPRHDVASQGSDDQPVLSIRASVPADRAAEFVAAALGDIRAYIQEHHATVAGAPFSICRDSGGGTVDVEACWPLVDPVAGSNRIHSGTLPGSLIHSAPRRTFR